jgi:hypothetical protein
VLSKLSGIAFAAESSVLAIEEPVRSMLTCKADHAVGTLVSPSSEKGSFMRSIRIAVTVAAVVIAPALLLSSPALAVEGVHSPQTSRNPAVLAVSSDTDGASAELRTDEEYQAAILRVIDYPNVRTAVHDAAQDVMSGTLEDRRDFVLVLSIIGYPDTGREVRSDAQEALEGTSEDRSYFLQTGRWIAQAGDDRFAVAVVLGDPDTGREVHDAAEEALEAGTPEALRYFLQTGRWIAQEGDDTFAMFRILADPNTSQALHGAVVKALDGTAENRRDLLEILDIIDDPDTRGTAVRREAQEAFAGTVQDWRYFLETGRWIAQEEDDSDAMFRMIGDPNTGKLVYDAVVKALDGTAEDRSDLLEVLDIIDDSHTGTEVRVAAQQALEGTPEDWRYFLQTGRWIV